MHFFSKLIKPLLALAAAGLMLQATQGCTGSKAPEAAAPPKARAAGEGPRVIPLEVTEKGYEPSPITLNKDEPVKLVVTRKTDHTCATEIIMKDYNINTALPLNTPVEIAFTPTKAGTLTYGCAMGQMISGTFQVE
jgi:plastocyanin domain-containing protein